MMLTGQENGDLTSILFGVLDYKEKGKGLYISKLPLAVSYTHSKTNDLLTT